MPEELPKIALPIWLNKGEAAKLAAGRASMVLQVRKLGPAAGHRNGSHDL